MAATFAALEFRLNQAVFSRLSNATAIVAGSSIDGIFDTGTALGSVGMMGMSSTSPSFTLPTASVPDSPIGLAVVVGSASYLVAAHEPDGTGVSVLVLERSA